MLRHTCVPPRNSLGHALGKTGIAAVDFVQVGIGAFNAAPRNPISRPLSFAKSDLAPAGCTAHTKRTPVPGYTWFSPICMTLTEPASLPPSQSGVSARRSRHFMRPRFARSSMMGRCSFRFTRARPRRSPQQIFSRYWNQTTRRPKTNRCPFRRQKLA